MRVLIAEDDATSRLLLKKILSGWGYEVLATADGAAAWQALQAEGAPRLVVLDWMMPEMDGVDVCRRLRALETQEPPYVVLLTALGDKESVVAGLDAGADDFVLKPYDPDELRARLAVGRRFVELNTKLVDAQRSLAVQARTDALTGILNRGAILHELEREIERTRRGEGRLGVGMLDIDHFKRVNDAHGHAAGDEVLRAVVSRIQAVLRPYDRLGRFGGEEFLIVVPGADALQLEEVLERIRGAVARGPIVSGGDELAMTVSLGGALFHDDTADGLIGRADDALYEAKAGGRNRVALRVNAAGA